MRTDKIAEVGIDAEGSLWVKPASTTFPYIYREGREVRWDARRLRLYSPKPREWSYVDWFHQIRDAAREHGVELALGPATSWSGISPELRQLLIDSG
jgi:hypothetical protein